MAATNSTYAVEPCLTLQSFESLSTTQFRMQTVNSSSRLSIRGWLLQRPLLSLPGFYWLGFELADAELTLNGEDASTPVYRVPFAVKINRASGKIVDYRYNAQLKSEDREKLRSIYQTLHLNPPPAGANPLDYTLMEVDQIGQYSVRYITNVDGSRVKSRQTYMRIAQSRSAQAVFALESAVVNADELRFTEDRCWHTRVDGRSDIAIASRGDKVAIRTVQSLHVLRSATELPDSARLPTLPMDPLEWIPIPGELIYPAPQRQPMATKEQFLTMLSQLDGSGISNKALLQLLFDNDIYLEDLAQQIREHGLSDEFEQQLFLAIGKSDSPGAHLILTNLAVDQALDENTRFRSLMALKYAQHPIAEENLELLFSYARGEGLSAYDAELGHSAMMVLGIVARSQGETEFGQALSNRLLTELSNSTAEDRTAALLTAVGNSGNAELAPAVGDYLGDSNPELRSRAARALGQLSADSVTDSLRDHLQRERDPGVKIATLNALAQKSLDRETVDAVMQYTDRGERAEVRRAAIATMASQAGSNPEIRTQLRQLTRGEKDKRNLEILLEAIYSDDASSSGSDGSAGDPPRY